MESGQPQANAINFEALMQKSLDEKTKNMSKEEKEQYLNQLKSKNVQQNAMQSAMKDFMHLQEYLNALPPAKRKEMEELINQQGKVMDMKLKMNEKK